MNFSDVTLMRCGLLRCIVSFGFFLLLGSPAWAVTLEDLDAVLKKAGSVPAFLENSQLVDEYFNLAQAYYGGEEDFPRVSYDSILEQLRDLSARVPELNARLWETPADSFMGTSFRVQSSQKSYGRKIKDKLWNERLRSLRNQLSPELPQESLDELRGRLDAAVQSFRQSENFRTAPKKRRVVLEAEFFQKMRLDPSVRKWANFLSIYAIEKNMKDLRDVEVPDVTFAKWERIRQQPEGALGLQEGTIPSLVLGEMNKLLPSTLDLIKDETTFPREMTRTNQGKTVEVGASSASLFEFQVLPRRFHGIFKGVRLKECVGGSCKHLTMLRPERWATVALKDAWIGYLEKNGRFLGFTEAVPGSVGSERYATVSFGAKELGYNIAVEGDQSARRLYSYWIKHANQHLPPNTLGLVVSDQSNINNAGVLHAVWGGGEYRDGRSFELKSGRSFSLDQDPLASRLLEALTASANPGSGFAGTWVLDATTSPNNSRKLTVLISAPDAVTAAPPKTVVEGPSAVKHLIEAEKEIEKGDFYSPFNPIKRFFEDPPLNPRLIERAQTVGFQIIENGERMDLTFLSQFEKGNVSAWQRPLLWKIIPRLYHVNGLRGVAELLTGASLESYKIEIGLLVARASTVPGGGDLLLEEVFNRPVGPELEDELIVLLKSLRPGYVVPALHVVDKILGPPQGMKLVRAHLAFAQVVGRSEAIRKLFTHVYASPEAKDLGPALAELVSRCPIEDLQVALQSVFTQPVSDHFEDALLVILRRVHEAPAPLRQELLPLVVQRLAGNAGAKMPRAAASLLSYVHGIPNQSAPPGSTQSPSAIEQGEAAVRGVAPVAAKENRPLAQMLEPNEWMTTDGGRRLQVIERVDMTPSSVVYRVRDKQGRELCLKMRGEGQSQADFVQTQQTETELRARLRQAGVPAPETVESAGSYTLSTWTRGQRADEWLRDWQARGAPRNDPAIEALDAVIDSAAHRGIFLGNMNSHNLFWDGTRWAFAGATRGPGLQSDLPIQEIVRLYQLRMGSQDMRCLQSVLRLLMEPQR